MPRARLIQQPTLTPIRRVSVATGQGAWVLRLLQLLTEKLSIVRSSRGPRRSVGQWLREQAGCAIISSGGGSPARLSRRTGGAFRFLDVEVDCVRKETKRTTISRFPRAN